MFEELLKQLKFTDKEIEVYLVVLKRGKVSPAEVSKLTGINRTTVYSTAKELIKKGVITEDLGGVSRYLVASPTQSLKEMVIEETKELEKKRENINQAMKELQALSKDAKYSIPKIVFIDEKNLNKYLKGRTDEWVKSTQEADNIWWGFQDHTIVKHYEEWIDWFWKEATPKEQSLRLLSNKSPIEKKMKTKKYPQRHIKFWSDSKQFSATTWIAGNYLIMVITNQRPHYLVEIHDATLAHNMREVFRGLWKKIK